jgi:hypothetical protein
LRLCFEVSFVVCRVRSYITPRRRRFRNETRNRFLGVIGHYREGFLIGKWKAVLEATLKRSSGIGVHILEWAFDTLDEDHALGRFFEALPGFFDSTAVNVLQSDLPVGLQNQVQAGVGWILRPYLPIQSGF